MKILAYVEDYAAETVTFIVNELARVQENHELVLIYSNRINPQLNNLPSMVEIPFKFNRVYNKLRWWLEQTEVYYTLYNYNFKKKLNKTISKFKPDLIHCHFGTDFLKVFANLNREHKKIPMLISFYGYDVTERISNKAVLRKYKDFMTLKNIHSIAVSETLVNKANNFIKPYNPATLLHSGINTDFFDRKKIVLDPEKFIFLQVSTFYQRKGHQHTLEAFRKFIDQDKKYHYSFIIAGFGPLETEIRAQIKLLGLESHVEMRGPVTPSEMVDLASRVNCFVHMSITSANGEEEGLPNVLLEAMSLELPILSTWHAGIPEIIEDKKNGILCKEKDILEYVKGFQEISDWKHLRINRDKIIQTFSIHSHMEKLNELYKKIKNNNEYIC